jgi:hypothetical protein
MRDEGSEMSDERRNQRSKTQMAHGDNFVQILTMHPFGGAFSPEERKALFFPRISRGRLVPAGYMDYTKGGENWM